MIIRAPRACIDKAYKLMYSKYDGIDSHFFAPETFRVQLQPFASFLYSHRAFSETPRRVILMGIISRIGNPFQCFVLGPHLPTRFEYLHAAGPNRCAGRLLFCLSRQCTAREELVLMVVLNLVEMLVRR